MTNMIHTLYTFETSLVLMNCSLTFVFALRKLLYLKVVETMTPSCINFSHCTTVNLCKDAKVIQSKLKHITWIRQSKLHSIWELNGKQRNGFKYDGLKKRGITRITIKVNFPFMILDL